MAPSLEDALLGAGAAWLGGIATMFIGAPGPAQDVFFTARTPESDNRTRYQAISVGGLAANSAVCLFDKDTTKETKKRALTLNGGTFLGVAALSAVDIAQGRQKKVPNAYGNLAGCLALGSLSLYAGVRK